MVVTSMTGKMDVEDPAQPNQLEIIFYNPNPEPSISARKRSEIPIQERLTDQLQSSTTQRLRAEECLKLFPPCSSKTALKIVLNLASSLPPNKEQRNISGFLLFSLYATLDISGCITLEEIDKVVKTLTISRKPKYLDKLKRGAQVANKIIAKQIGKESGDRL